MSGQTISHYRIIEKLGEGEMFDDFTDIADLIVKSCR